MPILTYARMTKTTVVKARHIETHSTFHFESDSGFMKFGVTPAGGFRAGVSSGVVAMLVLKLFARAVESTLGGNEI